jgi:phage-related protein
MAQSCRIFFESNAGKEYYTFPKNIRVKGNLLLGELNHFGTLKFPDGRKLKGYDLFEVRIIGDGIYRLIYTHIGGSIIVLVCFRKKSKKTPIREIEKALGRRKNLI